MRLTRHKMRKIGLNIDGDWNFVIMKVRQYIIYLKIVTKSVYSSIYINYPNPNMSNLSFSYWLDLCRVTSLAIIKFHNPLENCSGNVEP